MAGQLKPGIRLYHATALVVGSIIGASIFVQPSEVTGPVPSLVGAALVWSCAGILSFFGALVAAELASTFPETGGVYCYLREAFSPLVGFLWGWAMFWTMHILLLGELDDANETRGSLRRSAAANRQGLHRLARGKYAFSVAQREAQRLGVSLAWSQQIVPGVGHDYRAMGRAAAELLYAAPAR